MSPPLIQPETACECPSLRVAVARLAKERDEEKASRDGWHGKACSDAREIATLRDQVERLRAQRDTAEKGLGDAHTLLVEAKRARKKAERLRVGLDEMLSRYDLMLKNVSPVVSALVRGWFEDGLESIRAALIEEGEATDE